jgi:hypothetical protein
MFLEIRAVKGKIPAFASYHVTKTERPNHETEYLSNQQNTSASLISM